MGGKKKQALCIWLAGFVPKGTHSKTSLQPQYAESNQKYGIVDKGDGSGITPVFPLL